MTKPQNIAIVGATGAVGSTLLAVLEQRNFPVASLRPLASPRSAGQTVSFQGKDYTVEVAGPEAFEGIDIAFFSAGATRSKALVPAAREAGAVIVDNSSGFRMHTDVPLVVPEVNPEDFDTHTGLIANPNCVAAILTIAVAPLRTLGNIKRLVVSTYQSASGAGARAMEDLEVQTRAYLDGKPVVAAVLKHPYAFNLFSHDAAIEENGYNGEENKVVDETRKILGMPELPMSVTCVRVPVLRAHTMSINVEFDTEVTEASAREAIANAEGVTLVDDRENNHFPMPNEASGEDNVRVGRIRRDPSHTCALNLMVSGDQLLKGAALNAVQIAEMVVARS